MSVSELIPLIVAFAIIFTVLRIQIKVADSKRLNKRFIYCDGSKSRVLYVDMVNTYDFRHYDRLIGYGIIDRNSSSIYFDVPSRKE